MVGVLEVKNLVKKFKDISVVNNVSFNVKEGEVVGLVGENGAGKTTTLRMISTILEKTSGQIKINGCDISKDYIKARKDIGILFGGDVGLFF